MKISKALIFDIKRFAVHDGEGIRTTLFFKGCPLRCKWCQNPEGLLPKRQPIFLPKKCVFCRFCDRNKKENQMTFTTRPVFNLEYPDFDNLRKSRYDGYCDPCGICHPADRAGRNFENECGDPRYDGGNRRCRS